MEPAETIKRLREGENERRSRYLAAAAAAAQNWYNPEGDWVAESTPAACRERLWICFALYEGGDEQCRLADAIVRKTEVEAFEDGHRFNIFTSNIAPILYAMHRDRMAEDVRQMLLELTQEGHHTFPGDRQCDYQFHGYNDNMPAKGTMSLIVGGELVGNEQSVSHGLWQLRQFQHELTRNGLNSEYTSPTYSALTLHAMASIREFSGSEEAREGAAKVERRLWADLACHWHTGSRQIAGPHSRAYTRDHVGHISSVRSMVWLLLGEEASGISPMAFFEHPPWLVYHHAHDVPFNITAACWFIAGHYHLDEDLAALFLNKPDPFELVATSEHGDSTETPTRRVICSTYMTRDYSVGTSTVPFGGGEQTDTFYVTCSHDEEVPVGSTIYLKYVINDDHPGMVKTSGQCTGETDHLVHHALNVTLHSGPSALLSCRPHRNLAEQDIHRMALMVIFPTHLHGVDELIVDGQRVEEWEGEFSARCWIGVKRGRCYLALRPLAYMVNGPEAVVKLERFKNYQVIAIEGYKGESKRFTTEELLMTFNGFAAELAGQDEFSGLPEFLAHLQEARFEDYYMFNTRRMRYLRPAIPGRQALEITLCYSVTGVQWGHATINGKQIEAAPWRATGLPPEKLPLLTEPYSPQPAGIPWENLRVLWYPRPWAIHESGR